MRFTKMHGCGNDYIIVNCFEETEDDPSEVCVRVSDRHFGIGSDGLILVMPSETADFRMRMFNSDDGSEAEMCGNGIRLLAKYVYDHGLTDKQEITVETLAGARTLQLRCAEGRVEAVRVNMGAPRLDRAEIPMQGTPGRVIGESLSAGDREFLVTAVSMGNPHCVIFVDDTDDFPVQHYGPLIEHHPAFPQRTNVEFVTVLDRNEIKIRTWERGAGETLACGTGASGTTVACVLNDQTGKRVTAHLLGGDLELEWAEDGNVYMTGPAAEVFEGQIDR